MEALILIDIQNDFLPGGALAVPEGDQIIPITNKLQKKFELVVATQDFHPKNHKSFAANHAEKEPGDHVELKGMDQILWPIHCVQGTKGAAFADALNMDKVEKIFQKGTDAEIDSYSGFYDNGHLKATGLGDYLKEKGVDKVVIVGLAADYCVKFTALDAVGLDFETTVVKDATRAVNLQEGDFEKALEDMKNQGVTIIDSTSLL